MVSLCSWAARPELKASAAPGCIIWVFAERLMEAEHINLIAKRLDDVGSRAAELRRYL